MEIHFPKYDDSVFDAICGKNTFPNPRNISREIKLVTCEGCKKELKTSPLIKASE